MEDQVYKLLDKYRANRSLKNAQAIVAYDRKHPFAACVLELSDLDLFREAVRYVATVNVWRA